MASPAAVLMPCHVVAPTALRGGASDSDDDNDNDAAKFVAKALRGHEPAEVEAASEFLTKRLRASAAASGRGSGRFSVAVGRGQVEMRVGNATKDVGEQEQEVLEEVGDRVLSPIERMRRDLRNRMELEDAISRRFYDMVLQRNFSAAYALLQEVSEKESDAQRAIFARQIARSPLRMLRESSDSSRAEKHSAHRKLSECLLTFHSTACRAPIPTGAILFIT